MRAAPHQHSIAQKPLLPLATTFALGILAAQFIHLPLQAVVVAAGLSSVAAFVFLHRHRLQSATAFVTAALFLLGASLAMLEERAPPDTALRRMLVEGVIKPDEPIELTGVVVRAPEYAPQSIFLNLQIEKVNFREREREASGLVAISIPFNSDTRTECELLELRHGARLRVMTTLERAEKFRNPGVPSFTEYLDRRGYDATAFVKSPLLIERLEDDRVFMPLAWLYEWRRRVQQSIHERFSADTAGVLDASLLGNRYSLSRSTAERFREGGTFHVLVISGLHISFIGGVVLLIARRFTRNKKTQFLVSTLTLWGYTVAVGAEVSVARAAFMFTFVTFAPLVFRRAASLNALAAAALVLLVVRPSSLFDPSFQLTFVSVAAIVVLAWPLLAQMYAVGSWRPTRETPFPPNVSPWLREISEVLFWNERQWRKDLKQSNYSYQLFKSPLAAKAQRYHLQRLLRYMFAAVIVSVSVQLALVPLLILYFHRLSLVSVVLNIGVGALMAALSIVSLIGLAVGLVSSVLALPLIQLASGLNWLMVHIVDPFAAANVASLRVPEYSGPLAIIYGLYYLPLLAIAHLLLSWNPLSHSQPKRWRVKRLRRSVITLQLVAVLLIVLHPFSAVPSDGKLRIDFLDVGQGDAALVTMPDGVTLLIDGGGTPDFGNRLSTDEDHQPFERDSRSIGEAVVSEYLWSCGLDSVDYLLATHADADHMHGLNDIARNFQVTAAFVGREPFADKEYSAFARTMSREGVPIVVIRAGDYLQFNGVGAHVLWPPLNSNSGAASGNNESVVLRLEMGDRSIIFTGDIESRAEAELLNRDEKLESDLVKVAHHGSKTSSTGEFIDRVRTKWAVISVGQNSIFGHPDAEVVARWKASGAHVLTTGNSGMITVTTDGHELLVEEYIHRLSR